MAQCAKKKKKVCQENQLSCAIFIGSMIAEKSLKRKVPGSSPVLLLQFYTLWFQSQFQKISYSLFTFSFFFFTFTFILLSISCFIFCTFFAFFYLPFLLSSYFSFTFTFTLIFSTFLVFFPIKITFLYYIYIF